MRIHSFFASLAVCVLLSSSCGALQNLNQEYVASAAAKTLTAASITDSDIIQLSAQSVEYMDQQSVVLTSGSYYDRINKVVKGLKAPDGLTFNVKVYKTTEINAFACGDGSIRVYSGLMDVMDDDMLVAIIGHEVGHIVHGDVMKAMKRSYLSSAARDAVTSVGGIVGQISASMLGDLAETYVSARFSQKQEYAADAYGFQFAIDNGHDKYSMANALNKLLELSGGQSTSGSVANWFASHPDTGSRVERVKAMADAL